jgi:hypothetical protein
MYHNHAFNFKNKEKIKGNNITEIIFGVKEMG